MEIIRNMIGWFEIPVINMDRAMAFYSTVFDIEMTRTSLDMLEMAWFPYKENIEGSPGSLVCHKDHYQPTDNGVLIYFTSQTGNLDDQLNRVEQAGGKVLKTKTQISETHGFMGLFLDTEGNRIAIHSRS